jgi:nucleoside-diphosphate-sugar epimerase
VLIHPIPPIEEPGRSSLRDLISSLRPSRILYISSTGVYGAQSVVDSSSPATPQEEKHRARIEEEGWIARPGAPWTSLILRSAAIYGPGRGVHVRLREGKLPRGAGGVVSRIHVEDLAAILEASIGSTVAGTWPVADDYPAASEEVAGWCAAQMSIPLPNGFAPRYPVAGRRVDGSRIRQLLGIGLLYPSYREGISAILRKENAG